MIIFGWGKGTMKDHGAVIAAECPRCHNQVALHHVQTKRWFTLFFIPVIPYSASRVLVCPVCSWRTDLPKSALPLAEEMTGITTRWRAGEINDADYAQRVDAFWSFQRTKIPSEPTTASPAAIEPPSVDEDGGRVEPDSQ